MYKPLTNGLVPLLLAAAACSACAQSQSEERSVAEFSRLSAHGGVDVYLTQSDRASLRVEVEGVELEDVISEVVGDELRLSRLGGWRPGFFQSRDVNVYLDFVELTAIEAAAGSDIHGRGTIRVDELSIEASAGSDVELGVEAEHLELALSGGSDLILRGSGPSLVVDARGGSDIAAGSFAAERVRLVLSGGSDAAVRAATSVEIDAHGGSDVAIHGDPSQRTVDSDRSSDVTWH